MGTILGRWAPCWPHELCYLGCPPPQSHHPVAEAVGGARVWGTTSSHLNHLTHWGRVTHICVSKLTIIGSYNGLSPGRRQAIIWTNAGILLIRPLGTNFNEMLIEILTFSFMKMRLKVSSAKWRPFCLGHNVLTHSSRWPMEVMSWQLLLHVVCIYYCCNLSEGLHKKL